MPDVSEITYSHDATVEAVRKYFQFLAVMYMDESKIIEPPEGGWDTISPEGWPNFDKTEEVVDLLRHLPYLETYTNIAPHCEFMAWHSVPADLDGADLKEATEPHPEEAQIPSHIVGLTAPTANGLIFLLDTELGVIYWHECMSEAKVEIPEVHPDAYGMLDDELIPEDQVEWRADSGIWEISDFFEMLKANFRTLNFVPFHQNLVRAAWYGRTAEDQETLEGVQKIYKDHGWPDLARYRKNDCLATIDAFLKTRD
jgi:hypothetical protein